MKTAILVLWTALLCEAGTIRVLVRDPSGAAVAGAHVRAGDLTQPTDESGQAVFADLPPGRVDVRIEAEGFTPYATRVTVRSAGTITIDRTLQIAERSDTVDVTAAEPASTVLTQAQIDQLPDDVDEMERVLKEMAGPGAALRVDGFRGGRLPHKSQIQSIRFRLTAYSADEHDDGFMLIDVITKPGLGEWHGDVSFAFGEDSLNARNAFARVREPQQSRRLDLNLFGPVVKNRTSTSFNLSSTDGYDARVANGLLPEGAFSRVIRLASDAMTAGARVQHALTRTQVLRGDYQFERSTRGAAGFLDLPERLSTARNDLHQLRLSLIGSVSERVTQELRFQSQGIDFGNTSATQAPSVLVQGAFQSGGANVNSHRSTRAFEITDHVSYNKGKHSIRTGFQIDHLRHRGRDFTNGFGTTVYPSLAAYLAGQPALTSRRSAEVSVGYLQTRLAAYIQDDIRVSKNFSLSLGVRPEAMSQISDRWNLAPRIGFAWSPFRSGKTTLRGGGGIFHQWYEASLYEETLRLNGAAQVDLISSPSGVRLPGFLRSVRDLRMPYTMRASLGVQQQLPGRLNLMIDYRQERGMQLLRTRDVNTPGSELGYLLQLENGARSRMDALLVAFNLMPAPGAKGWRGRLFWNTHYMLSRGRDEISSALTPPADSSNARGDWGPSAMDVRHRWSMMSQYTVGGGWQIGTFMNVASAPPYNVTTGFDENRDTFFNDRAPSVGRNSGRGAGVVNVSARIAWSHALGTRGSEGVGAGPQMVRVRLDGSGGVPDLGFGSGVRADARVRMQLFAQATNAINTVNETGFVGVMSSPLFGLPTTAMAPRRLEVGVRFGF